jgi:hypothetical protein
MAIGVGGLEVGGIERSRGGGEGGAGGGGGGREAEDIRNVRFCRATATLNVTNDVLKRGKRGREARREGGREGGRLGGWGDGCSCSRGTLFVTGVRLFEQVRRE